MIDFNVFAKKVVSKIVDEDGLDCNSQLNKIIEKRIEDALKEQDFRTRLDCLNSLLQCEDVNDTCADTEIVWHDRDDVLNSCKIENTYFDGMQYSFVTLDGEKFKGIYDTKKDSFSIGNDIFVESKFCTNVKFDQSY